MLWWQHLCCGAALQITAHRRQNWEDYSGAGSNVSASLHDQVASIFRGKRRARSQVGEESGNYIREPMLRFPTASTQ